MMMTVFITLGTVLLIGMFYNVILYQRPGIYPPKKILRARVASLGCIGGLIFVAGILMAILSK
ncbi:Uncharacterised protein [Bacillus freudenreichii]|nr:Uncharacterised protein [Bacillus freudenreichii]